MSCKVCRELSRVSVELSVAGPPALSTPDPSKPHRPPASIVSTVTPLAWASAIIRLKLRVFSTCSPAMLTIPGSALKAWRQ